MRLTLNETFTMLAEITDLINEWLIGMKSGKKSETGYLSPLGRYTEHIASGTFKAEQIIVEDPKAASKRYLLV